MKSACAVLAVAALAVGCGDEGSGSPENVAPVGDVGTTSGALQIDDASLSGVLNAVAIEGEAIGEGWHEPSYTMIESRIDGATAESSFMSLVYVFGGLDHEGLQPGAQLDFRSDWVNDYEGQLHVDVVGCQGLLSQDVWAFDVLADEVSVDVVATDDPNVVEFQYAATFTDKVAAQETISGSFLVELPHE